MLNSDRKYFEKFEFGNFPESHWIKWELVKSWQELHPKCYLIDCSHGGIGETYFLIDRVNNKFINVTDYSAW